MTMMMPVWAGVDEDGDYAWNDKFKRTINAVIEDLEFDITEVDLTETGTLVSKEVPVLVCGSTDPATVHAPIIRGPSVAMVMGTPKGLELLKRAVKLWWATVHGQTTETRYFYELVEPKEDPFAAYGSQQGYASKLTTETAQWLRTQFIRLHVDIETSGNIKKEQPEDTELLCVSVLFERASGKYEIATWTRAAMADPYCLIRLTAILTAGVPLTLHNGQFDVKWLNNKLKPYLKGRKIYPDNDTLLMHYSMYPGASGEHGLKDLAQSILGADEWEALIKKYTTGEGHFERVPPNLLCSYNAGDVYWTWQLQLELERWLDERPPFVRKHYQRLMRISRMLVDIEDSDNGWHVDLEHASKLRDQLVRLVNRDKTKLRMVVGDPTPYLPVASAASRARCLAQSKPLNEKLHEFNPSSPTQIAAWLVANGATNLPRTKKGAITTKEEALDDYLKSGNATPKVTKFIKRLQACRHEIKMLGTYVERVINNSRNGYMHELFKVFGTVTGRLASPIHTLPRPGEDELDYRAMYDCEPGEVIIGSDYAQLEARIVAELTGDPQMIDDFQRGRPDFFSLLLPGAFPSIYPDMKAVEKAQRKNPLVYKAHRQRIKPIAHGGNYMRQAGAMAKELEMPFWQAEQMLNSYKARYPLLQPWQEETMGFVRGDRTDPEWGIAGLWTMFGRRFQQGVITEKNGWSVRNSAIAFKPQSIGNDITLDAAMDFHNNHAHLLHARIVCIIHDAIYVVCPEQYAEAVKKTIEKVMEAAAARVFKRVPFPAEAHIGRNWREVS